MIWHGCIQRPVMTLVLFMTLGIFGIYAYLQMPVQENPDVDFPIISVSVELPGASPQVIDSEIIEPLEAEINTIEGLRQLTSTSRQQVGQIIAEFELWRDIDIAAQDVRDAVDRARRRLPVDAQTPIVRKLELGAQPIMWIALTGDQRWDDVRLTDYVDNVLKQQLETLRGVGMIQIGGMRAYAVRITLDLQRLAAAGLSMQDVVRTIQAENVDIPSGRVEGGRREFIVQTRSRLDSAEPFNDLVIAWRDGAPIRLRDVGMASDGVEDDRQLARFAGEITVGMGVVKTADANTVSLARSLRARMEHLAEGFPPGLAYTIAMDDSQFVLENIRDLLITIAVATLLVGLVVMGFLRSGRGTLVTLMAIPTSLLIGLTFMYMLDFSINVLTMLALILVIGIVIDDAIVVLERSYAHMEQGAEPKAAAQTGTTEVAFPNLANTMALGAVFLPVAFTGGLIGRFFLEFGVTITVTVFASTFVALTLTPMLCSRLLRVPAHHGMVFRAFERLFQVVERVYAGVLRAAFAHRAMTITLALLALALGVAALMDIPREFDAQEDRGQFLLVFETPPGSTLSQTDALARAIEAELAATPEIEHQFLAIGLAQGGPGLASQGMAFVRMTPRHQRTAHQVQVMQTLRARLNALPGGRVFITDLTPGGIGGAPVEVVLRHPDVQVLAEVQEGVMAWMRQQPDKFVGVRTDLQLNTPQVDVIVQRDRAAQLGVTAAEISNTLRYALGAVAVSQIEQGTNRYDVIPQITGRGSLEPDILRDMHVRNRHGALVSLDNLIRIEQTIGPSEIHRFNRMRSATISAQTPPGAVLGSVVRDLQVHLDQSLAADMDYELVGLSQLFEESFRYLTIAIVFSIVFIYLILAAQFESFIHPLAIMMALPMATTGAFGGLWLLGLSFNIYAFIGMIMLLGLVAKNAILLVDYSIVLHARGLDPVQAAQQAARERLRPVLMTAMSTVLGIAPLALGYGAGGEARMPLGVTVAAGLAVSTLLTLVVIPVVYTLFDQLHRRMLRHPDSLATSTPAAHEKEAPA